MLDDADQTVRIVAPEFEQLAYLADIERQAASVFSTSDLPDELRVDTVSQAVLEQAFVHGLLRVAISSQWVDGKLVKRTIGFVILERHDDALHLLEVSVLPECARCGIGRRLVTAALDTARRHSATAMTLTTFDHLQWNRPFYERCGFRVVAPDRLSRRLRETLASERAMGLSNRVAMSRRLDEHAKR